MGVEVVVVTEDSVEVEITEISSETSISTPGPPGPAGPAGVSESHTHVQSSPSTLWTVSPPWVERLPVSITVFTDRLGTFIESTDSVIVTMIGDGPSFTVDFGSNPESGKVTVS